jgi:hypothetical protein
MNYRKLVGGDRNRDRERGIEGKTDRYTYIWRERKGDEDHLTKQSSTLHLYPLNLTVWFGRIL